MKAYGTFLIELAIEAGIIMGWASAGAAVVALALVVGMTLGVG